jgi:hypothetical protein
MHEPNRMSGFEVQADTWLSSGFAPLCPGLTIGRNQRAKNGKISTPNKRSTELRMVLFKLLNARQSVTPDRAPVILLVDLLLESALNEPSTVLPPHER